MVPPNAPEVPREQPTPTVDTAAQLERLKESIAEGRMDAAVDTLIEFAGEDDAAISAATESFIKSLNAGELQKVVDFLSGNEDPAKAALRTELMELQEEVSGTTPETSSETPVQRILGAIDKGIERMGIVGKLNEFVRNRGFEGSVGPKQVEFAKKFLVDITAKAIEGAVVAMKNLGLTMDFSGIMNTSLELRLFGIADPEQREKYKEAYLAWAKNPTTPNPPTLQEVMNPSSTPAPTAVAETTPTSPTETQPEAPLTVESSSIVNFPDGTPNLEITRNDGKTTLLTDGKKAEMAVENMQSIAVRAPQGEDTGTVEMKLADGTTVSVSPTDLRNAVREKKTELLASNNTTKISLTDIPTV